MTHSLGMALPLAAHVVWMYSRVLAKRLSPQGFQLTPQQRGLNTFLFPARGAESKESDVNWAFFVFLFVEPSQRIRM